MIRQPASSPGRPAARSHAKAVGNYVPKLTRAAFSRHGFPGAGLLTDWPSIAGPQIAAVTMPERMKWPRIPAQNSGKDAAKAAPEPARGGATLVLRVDGAHALDVQYRSAQIIDRINAFFGYRAVSAIRLIQGPIPRSPIAVSASPTPARDEAPADLATALARLGRSVEDARTRVLARP